MIRIKHQKCRIGIRILFGFSILLVLNGPFTISIEGAFEGGWGFTAPAAADAIWNKESASPYSTQKAYKKGDIVNIIILESTMASSKAGTDTSVKDDLAFRFSHTLQRLAPVIGTNTQVSGNVGNVYRGLGQTSRSSNVQARIAAWVTEVFENGNLSIIGNHRVEVNDEVQEITITGIVRPKDISGANTIYSYQVANAALSIQGTGVVGETQAPGWLTRLFNWLF